MPRKYVPKLAPGTPRLRDEKGRLISAARQAELQAGRKKPGPKPKQPPMTVVAAPARKKPGPKPGFKRKPPVPIQTPPPVAAEAPASVPSVFIPQTPPPEPRSPFPSPEVYSQLQNMAVDIFNSGVRPEKAHKPEVILVLLLKGYELRIGPIQAIWNVYLGDDCQPLLKAELMRALVLRSGAGYLQPLERTDQRVTYRGVRFARRLGDPDTEVTVTWNVTDLSGGPMKGLPRHTLDARCTSEVCRTLFADIAGGYTPEDFDLPPHGGVSAPPLPPPSSPSQAAVAPEPQPEPPAPTPEPVPVPEQPPAPPAEPVPAPEPPAPAPEPTPAPPEPQAAPVVGSGNEEVMPGRTLNRMVQVTPPGEQTPRPVWTAGISADQVSTIYGIAGERYQAAAQKWLVQRGLQKLSWCNEAEGAELVAFLTSLANGEKPTAPPPLTFERAYENLTQVMAEIELPLDQVVAYIIQKHGVATVRDLLPEQLQAEADEFRTRATADLASFRIAFARLIDQQNMDPFA